jgi:uncharacterized protein (TIGR02466 family)
MKKILNLFSVPVLEMVVDNAEQINSRLVPEVKSLFNRLDHKRVLSYRWKNNIQSALQTELGWSSFNEHDISKDSKFDFFFEIINPIITDFFKQLQYVENWYYTNAWCNVYPKNSYVPCHDHRGVHWSGVYYAQADTDCGELMLLDPKEYALSFEPENTMFRGNRISSFAPVPGKLIIFPGYLKHETDPNLSDRNRKIISFNINCHE